jgi:hypothetical protein
MATRRRDITIDVVVDDAKARAGLRGLGDESTKTGKRFSDTAKVIGASMVAGAGVAVGAFVKSSIDSFSNLNESLNAVDVTFGQSAEAVKKLGVEAATNVGLSNAQFNSLAVQMSAFAQTIAGDAGDVAGTVDTLTTRVADFASVMNLDVAEAARLFQSGLAGETEPLRRFGIDLSAAAVTAHGLAMGLGRGTGALNEQEKVLARYDSLMQQTDKTANDFANTSEELANKTRIVAAETENAKAQIGEAFAPVMEAAVPIMGAAAENMGVLAISFLELTGKITPTESALRQFKAMTGETAETAPALLTILKEFDVDMRELVDTIPLTTEEVNKLREADEEFMESLGFTSDEIEDLNRMLEDKLVSATQAARDQGIHPVKEALDDAAVAADDATESTETYMDTLRALVDPAFAIFQKLNALEDAQLKYNEAVADGDAKSDEAQKAAADLGEAYLGLEGASAEYAAAGGKDSLDALINILTQAGVARDTIREIIAAIEDLNDTPVRNPAFFGGGPGGSARSRETRAHGGPVRAGGTYLVGEEGPELLSMGSSSGHVTPNNQLMSGGGGTTIIVQGYVGSEAQLAAELDRLLTKRKRQSGLGF